MYELLCQQAEGGTPRRVYQPTKGGTPMQELAAVPSVRQAVRMLKQMDMQAPEWGDYREAGRVALSRVIEERMHGLIGNRLAELRSEERRVGKESRSRWSPYH